jgi:perosamine synthetase
MNINLSKPSITDREIEAVVEVMKSGHIAAGKKVQEFEAAFAQYARTKYAIAVSSGTAGLFLCLKALGIREGDRVVTTPYSFVASTNCILHTGATPFYVDIDRDTYNLDVRQLIRRCVGVNISAILPVDVFGNPFDTTRINGLPVVLDACESLGSKMDRVFTTAVYAFYPNKQITTGEGGMIVTNNKKVYEFCVAMRNQGRARTDNWLDASYMGYNFRMTDIQAAIGLVQLSRIDEIQAKRQAVMVNYMAHLLYTGCLDNIKLQNTSSSIPFVFTVEVENRERIMLYLKRKGIETKPYFPTIHLQPYMQRLGYKEGMFPIAEEVAKLTMALPFYTDMTEDEVKTVCENLKEAMEKA